MPRPGPRRPIVNVKLSQAGIDRIDELAEAEGRNRSEQIRVMLAFATARMPAGWAPKGGADE